MTKRILRAAFVIALLVLAVLAWRHLFPSPENAIKKRMRDVARAASFSSNEAPLAKISNSRRLMNFCSHDVEVTVEVRGYSRTTLSGQEEVLQAALTARSALRGLSVEFLDVSVELARDKQTATVILTGKGTVPGEKELLAQELRFTMKKEDHDWLIRKVETVKTLF